MSLFIQCRDGTAQAMGPNATGQTLADTGTYTVVPGSGGSGIAISPTTDV